MPVSPRLAVTTAVLLATASLAGCSGDGETPEATETSTSTVSASPTPTTTLPVPEDETLTAPGTTLRFGQPATVAHETKDRGTILKLRVDSAKQGALKDFAGFDLKTRYQKRANYYYVRVQVRNVGKKRLGDIDVPLWGVSGNNTLLPPVRFTSAFAKCPTEQLPKGFKPGDRFSTCLVFLSPRKGELVGVSYRPTEDFLPIEWRGKVKTLKQEKAGKSKKTKNNKKN